MKAWSRRAATRGGALRAPAAAAVTNPLASDTRAVTHSEAANTQPNEVPDTVPASAGAAGAPHASEVAEAMALNQAKEKRLKRNEQAKKMRERRGEEIKEKQRIYAKTHREKLKKERENAMAIEEGLKQAASNGAVTHSDSANTQPNEVPDTVPASAGAPHVSEVAEAMALLNKAEERRLKEQRTEQKPSRETKEGAGGCDGGLEAGCIQRGSVSHQQRA
jgi:hypothetical protein